MTRLLVRGLVVDSGTGPHLCLGYAGDFRPDCVGHDIPLVGWTWPPATGTETRADNYVSGSCAMVGTYDGTRFRVDPSVSVTWGGADRLTRTPVGHAVSICAPPPGGWPSVAPPGATLWASLDANDLAQKLPGYGGSWFDDHKNTRAYTATLNVLVTHDVTGAVRRLRKVWSGSQCVGLTTHSFEQLSQISDEIVKLPGYASGGGIGLQSRDGKDTEAMAVPVDVVYDDGSLQREVDAKYGVGVVEITSMMTPYPG